MRTAAGTSVSGSAGRGRASGFSKPPTAARMRASGTMGWSAGRASGAGGMASAMWGAASRASGMARGSMPRPRGTSTRATLWRTRCRGAGSSSTAMGRAMRASSRTTTGRAMACTSTTWAWSSRGPLWMTASTVSLWCGGRYLRTSGTSSVDWINGGPRSSVDYGSTGSSRNGWYVSVHVCICICMTGSWPALGLRSALAITSLCKYPTLTGLFVHAAAGPVDQPQGHVAVPRNV